MYASLRCKLNLYYIPEDDHASQWLNQEIYLDIMLYYQLSNDMFCLLLKLYIGCDLYYVNVLMITNQNNLYLLYHVANSRNDFWKTRCCLLLVYRYVQIKQLIWSHVSNTVLKSYKYFNMLKEQSFKNIHFSYILCSHVIVHTKQMIGSI